MDKQGLWEKMTQAVKLSAEPIPGKSLVEILGDQAVLIENHLGIVSYHCDNIMVKTKEGYICVSGNRLCISIMSKEQLRIVGVIRNVEIRRCR